MAKILNPNLKAWKWLGKQSQEQALEQFVESGFSWYNHPEAVEMGKNAPDQFVEQMCGQKPTRCDVMDIRPVQGETTYVQSSREARFHTDNNPDRAADLQILICKTPAQDGGDSWLLDTWAVANEIKKAEPELFEALFNHARLFHFVTGLTISPTFSMRQKHLLATHAPYPFENDEVGNAFQSYVDRAPFTCFRTEPGDVAVVSNHRMLHGRSEFQDKGRHLIRILAWLEKPLDHAPSSFVRRANDYLAKVNAVAKNESSWVKGRLGIASAEQEIARHPAKLREASHEIRRLLDEKSYEFAKILRKLGVSHNVSTVENLAQTMIAAGLEALAVTPTDEKEPEKLFRIYQKLHAAPARRSTSSSRKKRAA